MVDILKDVLFVLLVATWFVGLFRLALRIEGIIAAHRGRQQEKARGR